MKVGVLMRMKQTINLLTLTFVLLGCNNQVKTEIFADKNSVDSLLSALDHKQQQDISIKDTSQYDQSFIDGLSEYNEPIKLIDNYILVGHDTVFFPEDIPLNKETTFTGIKGQNTFKLAVIRNNLTSLNYNFQLLDISAGIINQKSGKATISSLFFLGSETDEDDQTGESYLSTEYRDYSQDCTFSIRIENKEDLGKLRAKIELYGKENKSNNIDLDDSPTLRSE